MAVRYSGELTVRIAWSDRHSWYYGSVAHGRDAWSFDDLRPPPSGHWGAVDSPKSYDRAAEAAIAFAPEGLGERAEMDDQGYKVRRTAPPWMRFRRK